MYVYVIYSPHTGGSVIDRNTVTLRTCETFASVNGLNDILVHEFLHCCLKDINIYNPFEEALLDFIAPNGIFSEKLGLGKNKFKDGFDQTKYKIEKYRKWYDTLEPVMKRYEDGNLFEFLEENGIEIPKENKNK